MGMEPIVGSETSTRPRCDSGGTGWYWMMLAGVPGSESTGYPATNTHPAVRFCTLTVPFLARSTHPAVVFRLLPGVVDELGKDALAAAQDNLEVDGLLGQGRQGFQAELIEVVAQIAVV